MSSPAGGAAPSYDEQIERARAIQRRADRNLIIGTGLIRTMILGLFGLPFFIYGLWQLYKASPGGPARSTRHDDLRRLSPSWWTGP